MTRTIVLKLGGSLVTDKKVPYSLRSEVIRSASREIKECMDASPEDRWVIVHGVGSYGHPPVIEHKLYKGFIDKGQLVPISWTQGKVNELRTIIEESLNKEGVPVNLFHTSSIAMAEGGKITSMYLGAVRSFMGIGMVPLLGGDMVPDSKMGFSVGSGDQVATMLAREFQATDLIFATDVKGVYDKDPKSDSDARILKELSLKHMRDLSASDPLKDASGAMRGKMLNLENMAEELDQGLRINVISMMEPGKLRALLQGEDVEGTWIRP